MRSAGSLRRSLCSSCRRKSDMFVRINCTQSEQKLSVMLHELIQQLQTKRQHFCAYQMHTIWATTGDAGANAAAAEEKVTCLCVSIAHKVSKNCQLCCMSLCSSCRRKGDMFVHIKCTQFEQPLVMMQELMQQLQNRKKQYVCTYVTNTHIHTHTLSLSLSLSLSHTHTHTHTHSHTHNVSKHCRTLCSSYKKRNTALYIFIDFGTWCSTGNPIAGAGAAAMESDGNLM